MRPFWLRVAYTKIAFILLLLTASWLVAYFAKPYLVQPPCAQERCDVSTINDWDRPLLRPTHKVWSKRSDQVQFFAGAVGVLTPVLILLVGLGRSLYSACSTVLVLLFATVLNGALNEWVRILVQRPRPYLLLEQKAHELSNVYRYNSFYSGHTSFAALALTTALLWTLWPRRLGPRLLRTFLLLPIAVGLIVLTARSRVLAGEHYLTDTLVGGIVGVLVGLSSFFFLVRTPKTC